MSGRAAIVVGTDGGFGRFSRNAKKGGCGRGATTARSEKIKSDIPNGGGSTAWAAALSQRVARR